MVCWGFGWHPVWFYGISKLTDGPLSRSQRLPHSRDLLGLSCGWLYPCCGNGLLGFRLAPCLLLWDFKTDRWPPVPIPEPRPHWIELRLALPMLRMVCWDFGWLPVWFYGISKLTDGPLSRSQRLPHGRDLLALPMLRQWLAGISAGSLSTFMGFQN